MATVQGSPARPTSAAVPGSPARPRPAAAEVPPPVVGNYEIGKTIGKGSFGKVKLARFLPTGDKVAVKIINRQMLTNNTGMDAKIAREIKILKLFSHQNICRLYDVIATPTDILVVMENIPGKELYDVIVERGKLSEPDARFIFQQIICAIEYWHHYRVVHRDLKPENILLENDLTVKVIDFGLANLMNDGVFLRTSCGSPNYAAPEVISGRLYVGPEIDTWSSGVILYALLCGCLPFDEETIPALFKKIKAGEYRIPSHIGPEARDLLKRMLTVDPLERITIPQLRDHPWFTTNLPRFLQYRPTLFDNAATIDTALIPIVASTTHTTPADVMNALDRRNEEKLTKLQRSINVTYKILVDSKRRKEIEDMKRQDRTDSESGTAHGSATTAAMRELNLGLMLTASPAINAMLDSGSAAKNRETYNNQNFVPASMHDAKAITAGSMRIAASPGTFCFAGNPSSFTEKVGSLAHSLARRHETNGSTTANQHLAATYSGRTLSDPTASTGNSQGMTASGSSTTMLVGSVAKSGRVYDAGETTIAVENNVGWRIGVMTDLSSAALVQLVFRVLHELGLEWKCTAPFVIRVRRKPDTVLQLQPMRIAEKHEQGFVIDFQFMRGNTLQALELAISITDKLVLRLG
jgi:5'-AMP-activated protein kinase catalytic alpha subunit